MTVEKLLIEWEKALQDYKENCQALKKIANTKEWKERLSEAWSNGKNPNAIQVKCVETGQIFDTIKLAAQSVGCCYQTISNAIKTKKKAKGYHWEMI